MAGFKRSSKRRSYRRDLVEASSESSDALVSRNRELSSLYAGQLASPPASSGYTIPPSSPDDEEEREEIGDEPLQQMVGLDERSARTEVSSSGSKSEPSTSHSSPQTISREVFEPFDDSKHLSLAEKVKLLKICCSHRSQFLHCSTSGKHAEERIWTSVMEQFATTVRSGVFTKYSEVKKMTNKTCRNRRKHTKGIVPPQRRPRMGDLDMWIDRWVRIWKCRDLVVNIANAHESMRETIGEKKFKRIFRHRVDGSELPQDLGMLTLSAPLWKAIQKRIRTEERSIGTRHISIFPSEDESDWTDEEGTEDEATAETDDEGPPMDSIEEEFQDPPLEEPKGMVSTPNQEVERNLGFPDPSPRTQARLDQFEQGYTTVLKKEQGRTGKQTSVLDLAHKRRDRERSPPASPLEAAEVLEGGAAQLQFEEKGQTSPILNVSASSSNEAQDKEDGRLTSSPAERSVPERPLPGEVDVQRITGANSTRPQRLKPGTYSAGEGVLVGWHIRQLILAGMNGTATQDFRQCVFATIDVSGQIHLRLRAQNMQGKPVPSEFRLNGTISVSHKDIIYHPKFHGMSYDEMRLEVARQSRVAINQRICQDWVPTPVTEDFDKEEREPVSILKKPEKELPSDADATLHVTDTSKRTNAEKMEGKETAASSSRGSGLQALTSNNRSGSGTTPRISMPTETRRFAVSELPGAQPVADPFAKTTRGQPDPSSRKFQDTSSNRTGTPDLIRKFLAEEARKWQKPLAPHRIPHHSSPPKKSSPKGQTSNKNRITPCRFYGAQSSAQNVVEEDRQLSGPPEQPIILPQLRSGSVSNAGSPQNGMTSPRLPRNKAIPNTLLELDYSDNDSLPEVEEIHRRRVQAAKLPDIPASLQHLRRQQTPRAPSNCVVSKAPNALESFRPPESDNNSSQKDKHTCHLENRGILSGGTVENYQKLADDEPRSPGDKAITPSSSYSKKRARHQSMTNLSSNSPGNSRAGPSSSFAVPEPLDDITSTSNRHSAKRQRPPPKSEHVQTPVPTPDLTGYGLKPFRHPDLVSAASNNGAPCKEHVHPGVGPVDKGKGRATQSHTDNKYLASGSRPSNGNGYTPKWKTGARNATQSHRFYPYGQPATSSGPAASHKRRKNGGRGKRERHRGLNHHDRASGGSYSSNRFLREVTTDTVDFENFSTGAKCDILRRKISEVNEMLRKIEKND